MSMWWQVGSSHDVKKSITVVTWGVSATPVRVRKLALMEPVDQFKVEVSRETTDSFVLTVTRTNPPSKAKCATCTALTCPDLP